jgi:hypothetical protein
VLVALYTLQVAIRLITGALEDRDKMGDFPSSKVSLGFDRRLEMFTCCHLVQITRRGCLTGPARRGPMMSYMPFTQYHHGCAVYERVMRKGFQSYFPLALVRRKSKRGLRQAATPISISSAPQGSSSFRKVAKAGLALCPCLLVPKRA